MSLMVVPGKTMAYCLQINARDVKLKLLCCHLMPSDIIKLPRMSVSGQEAEQGFFIGVKLKKLISFHGQRSSGGDLSISPQYLSFNYKLIKLPQRRARLSQASIHLG